MSDYPSNEPNKHQYQHNQSQYNQSTQYNQSSQYNQSTQYNQSPQYNQGQQFNQSPQYNQGQQFNQQRDQSQFQQAFGQVPQFVPPAGLFIPQSQAPCTGRKKALLIGINYTGSANALRGCVNDVNNMKRYLTTQRFFRDNPNDLVVLTDDSTNPLFIPTRANIIQAIEWLGSGNNSGDSLFFQYSGHGGTTPDLDGDESSGEDETILPLDFQTNGIIVDDELNELLVRRLAPNVRLTALFDSCHSGSALDLPFTYKPNGTLKVSNQYAKMGQVAKQTAISLARGDYIGGITSAFKGVKSLTAPHQTIEQKQFYKGNQYADCVMFSGCKDSQTSADASFEGRPSGAMTYAFIRALTEFPNLSYAQLLTAIRSILSSEFQQTPQLSSCRYLDMNFAVIM